MAKYYEIGRFSAPEGDEVDWDAALFHEEHAAQLGVLEAIVTLAKLHLGMPREVLVNCIVQVGVTNPWTCIAVRRCAEVVVDMFS